MNNDKGKGGIGSAIHRRLFLKNAGAVGLMAMGLGKGLPVMASYGIYLAACGYEYHGPKGHLSFAPKLSPEDFRSAFTAAEGWGTFAQKREAGMQTDTLQLNYGLLNLKQLGFVLSSGQKATSVQMTLDGSVLLADHRMADDRVVIQLAGAITIQTGQLLEILIQV